MDMETKNVMVIAYINNIRNIFEKNGFHVTDDKVNEMINEYKDSPKTYEEIKREIDKFVKRRLEELIIKEGEGDFRQNFNYHTHTYRSGHSAFVSDEEMLKAAKEMGINMIGFTEHVPFPELVLPDEGKRMLLTETDNYIKSINELKESHPDMKILVGFEAEYDPMKESFLGEMREKVDYMILGQHFVLSGLDRVDPCTPEFPLIYADMVCKGIDSGLFDIVAHPDFFMRYRDLVKTEEGKKKFEENAVIASKKICERARDMGIPVEINLSQASSNRILEDGNYHYPHPLFWKEAAKVDGLIVVRGVDAHKPIAFKRAGSAEELVLDIEKMVKDKIIYYGFDPVLARRNNPRLQETYKRNQEKALSFETNLIAYLVREAEGKLKKGSSISNINQIFDESVQKCVANSEKKKKEIRDKTDRIISTENLDQEVKSKMLERMKEAEINVNMVLSKQEKVISRVQKMGLDLSKNYIILKKTQLDPNIQRIELQNSDYRKKYGLGFVSTLLISIITIIAGFFILTILYYFYLMK